ncbi:MAG TPA: hypothetical protein PKZ76_07940 [Xanthomonadaceae bacterium]|nr:hypothetical protein [Xanthomonadaceae bacterium]
MSIALRLFILGAASVLLFVQPVHAQFSGDYAPPTWTTILEGDPPGGGGPVGVDVSNAPDSIIVIGGDDEGDGENLTKAFVPKGGGGCVSGENGPMGNREDRPQGEGGPGSFGCWIDYLNTAQGDGEVSFDWDYDASADGAEYELFGYVLNGVFVQLSDDNGGNLQSGSMTFPVSAGDEFGFRHDCTDCCCGGAFTVVSAFAAPAGAGGGPALPDPRSVPATGLLSVLLLVLSALLFGWVALRRG